MKRIALVSFCIASGLLLLYLYFSSDKFTNDLMSDVLIMDTQKSAPISENKDNEGTVAGIGSNTTGTTNQESAGSEEFSAEENRQIALWAEDRGWKIAIDEIDGELVAEADSYSTYGEETLLSLAESGDRMASQILGEKWIATPERHEAAMQLLFDSAVRGYSKPFVTVAIHYQQLYFSPTASAEKRKVFGATAYSWAKAGVIRADSNAESTMNMLKSNMSPSELKEGEAAAEALMAKLLEKRNSIGLGDFDNNIPEAVKKSQERSRRFRKSMGSY